MFTVADGPTALRGELVCALSLSMNATELADGAPPGRCCAALAAVWNGRKGTVALLLRSLDEPAVQRHVFSGPLTSEDAVLTAVDEGLALAESFGFSMDSPEFGELDEEKQRERLGSWNEVRKVKKTVHYMDAAAASAPVAAKASARPDAREETGDPTPGKAVLGRLSLVRQETGEQAGPLARLLSFF